jgi:hypothetical protein
LGDRPGSRHRCPQLVPTTGGPATNWEELATNWEELATNWEELATNQGVLGPSRPGIAPNLGRASPTRQGVAARARPDLAERAPRGLAARAPRGLAARAPLGLATNPAAQAKRRRALAMKVAWPPGPEELEGLEVPRLRPLDQTITRLAASPGGVRRATAAGLSARSGGPWVLACCREDFFGGVQDGLG